MARKESAMMHKTVILSALAAMMFHLSLSFIFYTSDCMNNCTCCREKEKNAHVINSDCCNQQTVKVSNSCCYNEHSHITQLILIKYQDYRNIMCDLRAYIFNNHILIKISGVDYEEQLFPVDIVYFIFKPPIIL